VVLLEEIMQIKSLTLKNYMCFDENVYIEFPLEDCSTLIIGNNQDSNGMSSNESGKTSFASAPFWILFGNHYSEDASADDVIRKGTTQCLGSLELIDNSDLIKITRKRGTTNTLEFYVNDRSMNENITVPSKVQETINNYFGIKGTPKQVINDFMSTNFLSYNSVDMFVSKRYKASDRFAFISRMFDLEKWMDCKDIAVSKMRDTSTPIDHMEGQLLVYKNTIDSIDCENLRSEINQNEMALKESEKELVNLEKQRDTAKAFEDLKQRYQEIHNNKESLSTNYTFSMLTRDKKINNVKVTLEDRNADLSSKKQQLADLPKAMPISDTDLKELRDKEKNLNSKVQENKYTISSLKNQIVDRQHQKEKGLECSECGANQILYNNKLIKFDMNILDEEIKKFNKEIDNLGIENSKIVKEVGDCECCILAAEDSLSLKSTRDTLDLSIEHILDYINLHKNEVKELLKEQAEYKSTYEIQVNELGVKLSQLKIQIDVNTSLSIYEIERQISSMRMVIQDCRSTINLNKDKIKQKETAQEQLNACKKEIDKLKKKRDTYKYWTKAFPEIRRMIIQSILPQIQEISNEYLKKIEAPFQITLDTLKELKTSGKLKEEFNIDVYDKITDTVMPIHMRSTGGRKRVGMAVCFALQDIKTDYQKKSFDFRFFDEFLDNIDETGVDLFLNLIENIKGQKLTISHNSKLAERFNKVITITKQNGVSTVV